jgi:hypothetical protein
MVLRGILPYLMPETAGVYPIVWKRERLERVLHGQWDVSSYESLLALAFGSRGATSSALVLSEARARLERVRKATEILMVKDRLVIVKGSTRCPTGRYRVTRCSVDDITLRAESGDARFTESLRNIEIVNYEASRGVMTLHVQPA